jgi:valyl-tRNA synthetase
VENGIGRIDMKKYVAGFLVGALFTVSATAFADEIKTMVGKKIQGEMVVELNGQALDTAIIVDGKSYAPTRSIGEAAGFEVNMKDKKIILSETTATTSPEPQAVPGYSGKENNVTQIESLKKRISDQESRVDFLQERFDGMNAMVSSPDYVDRGEKAVLEVYRSDLEKGEAFLEELKTQLAELQK